MCGQVLREYIGYCTHRYIGWAGLNTEIFHEVKITIEMSYQYMENLPGQALQRYRVKLSLVGLHSCPYKDPADLWINNPTDWPRVEYPDVYHYLINTPGVFTHEAMKNYRSLEAHKFFVSGWVQTILHQRVGSNFVFKADVKPSWRVTEQPHHPWVAVSSEGVVIAAHCDCMAGLGESCSHIAAVLFKLEAAVRMGYTSMACTSELCKWNACFTDKVQGAAVNQIKFYAQPAKDKMGTSKQKSELKPASEAEQQQFLNALASAGSNSVGLSAFANFAEKFIPSKQPSVLPQTQLPVPLRQLFSTSNRELSAEDLDEKCQTFQVTVSEMQISYVEESSKAQASSLVWHEQRAGRITGSTAHQVLHTNTSNPAPSIIKKVCTLNPVAINTPAMQWGRDHEDSAYTKYTAFMKETHKSCETSKAGFQISKSHPFLGASPDGYVTCQCCGKGTVEIKCPYKNRDMTISEAAKGKDFCLDENMKLKTAHPYYTQVQMQMFVCDLQYSDFVLWTNKSFNTQRILWDQQFISSMLVKLEIVWRGGILPELFTRTLEDGIGETPAVRLSQFSQSQTSQSQTLYCICRTSETVGDMVGCDRCDEWFHLRCLKMKRLPVTKTWYCAACKKQKTKT